MENIISESKFNNPTQRLARIGQGYSLLPPAIQFIRKIGGRVLNFVVKFLPACPAGRTPQNWLKNLNKIGNI